MSEEVQPHIPPARPPFVPKRLELNPNFDYKIGEVLGDAWKVLTGNFWPLVGLFAFASIIFGVASNLIAPIFFMTFPIMGGYYLYSLNVARGVQNMELDDCFDGFKRRFGALSMISFILVIPIILMVIPLFGFIVWISYQAANTGQIPILSIVVMFIIFMLMGILFAAIQFICTLASNLCLDCDYDSKKALKLANQAYRKTFFKSTCFAFLIALINSIGYLALIVGVFVAGAWTTNAIAQVYQRAFIETQD